MKENEKQGGTSSLGSEAIAITLSFPFDQAMGFQFPEIVADLVEDIGFNGQAEGGEDCLAEFGAPPSVELSATMQQDLHHAHHSGVVDLDAGDFRTARSNR